MKPRQVDGMQVRLKATAASGTTWASSHVYVLGDAGSLWMNREIKKTAYCERVSEKICIFAAKFGKKDEEER